MKSFLMFFGMLTITAAIVSLSPASARSGKQATTATGIPIDSEWKSQVYAYAQKNVRHPSWGIAHSERDYQMTRTLGEKEGIPLDLDVLFACAFLHDLGGIAPYSQEGVDHAVRSATLVEPLLRQWGFPMEKWPAVKDMILGHTYYGPVPDSLQSKAFRDADVIDFLGALGVARILAVTEEPGEASDTLQPTMDVLRKFEKTMAGNCQLPSCRELAKPRQAELEEFLRNIDLQSLHGEAL